ncbi:HAMP domain-containing protein [Desulfovibrio aerotolerans]|uniref:HAMP domain-containing protein n=1 Tax=Solidesulfovibrio aerotolerans TaxID=295255 RepID=A0A7C9ML06_9BACT|nr:methyl-accepting chemotaxis protein [Solidesulfovibrio aerotolerans]MYL83373.1 HAMP domain-containing protein [Solidesulfovibrio aerotolerans]
MRVSISTKVMTLVIASVVATVAIIQCVAFSSVRNGYKAITSQAVRSYLNVFNRQVGDYKDTYLDMARTQASRPTIVDAILAGNADRLRELGQMVLSGGKVDLVVFTDAKATVVARAHTDKAGDNIGNQEGIKRALAGESVSLFEPGNTVGFSLRAYAPVKKDGVVVGVVIIGQDVANNTALVDSVKRDLGAEATIFFGDTRVSTSLLIDGKRAVGTKLDNQAILEAVLRQGKTFFGENRIFGREFRTAYEPLKNGETIVGMVFIGLDITEALAARDAIILQIGLAGLGSMVVFAVLSWLFARVLTRPLLACMAFARAVSKGETNQVLDVSRKDETGVLAKALTAMAGDIRCRMDEVAQAKELAEEEAQRARAEAAKADEACRMAENAKVEGMIHAAGRIESVVEAVTASSEQLAAQIEQSSRGAEDQSKQVAEAAGSMDQLNSTVLEVAKNASQAADSADAARTKAEEGAAVVDAVVKGIATVADQARTLKDDMGALGQKAEGIGAIMDVISDIADQTNLLALNAAIEAARAGDAGRGFAVVADEVRKLAEKTMAATKEVGAAIKGIQDGTQQNVAGFDKAVQNVEAATTMARRSGEALTAIVGLVEVVADQVRSIATAAEEQSAAAEEIGRTVDRINRISGETAQAMHASADAVDSLAGQAKNLHGLVLDMQNEGSGKALA